MKNGIKKLKFNISKILIALLISFSFVFCTACSGLDSYTGSSDGSKPGFGEIKPDPPPVISESFSDFNGYGVIAEYFVNENESIFYDKYLQKEISFLDVVNRQFDVLSQYIYNGLVRIYSGGVSSDNFYINMKYYGRDISVPYIDVISDNDQKSIINIIHNSANKNYYLNSKETWKNNSRFNIESLKKSLGYIYLNMIKVENVNDGMYFSNQSNIKLKENYINFDFTISDNFTFENKFNYTGFSKEYMYNVINFLAYSIIGETNINNSINNHNKIIPNKGNIDFDSIDSCRYRGYNVVIPELVINAFNACIGNDYTVKYNDYFKNGKFDSTFYPIIAKKDYRFFTDYAGFTSNEENNDFKVLNKIYYLNKVNEEPFKLECIFLDIKKQDVNTLLDISVDLNIGAIKDNIITNNVNTFNFNYSSDDESDNNDEYLVGNKLKVVDINEENDNGIKIDSLIYMATVNYGNIDENEIKFKDSVKLKNNPTNISEGDDFILKMLELSFNGFKKDTVQDGIGLNVYNNFINITNNGVEHFYEINLLTNYITINLDYYDLENNFLEDGVYVNINNFDFVSLGSDEIDKKLHTF